MSEFYGPTPAVRGLLGVPEKQDVVGFFERAAGLSPGTMTSPAEAERSGTGPLQAVDCHSCGQTTHAEHLDTCPMCGKEDLPYCCLCWDAEDTSCMGGGATRRMNTTDARQVLLDQQSEADWQAQVLEWAKRGHWRVYHTRDSRRSPAGFPDLVLVSPGRRLLLAAELKRNTGQPTAAQRAWLVDLAMVRRVEVGVWRPNDWEYVKALLLGSQEVGRSG